MAHRLLRRPGQERWEFPNPLLPRRLSIPDPGQRTVALFTDDFFPQSGGVARAIEQQVRELVDAGLHVTLFAPRTHFDPPSVGDYVTLPTIRLPGTPSYLCTVQFDEGLVHWLARLRSFDIVHSHNERGSLLLAAGLARLEGIPHVHTFHSNYAGIHDTSPVASRLTSGIFLPVIHRLLRLWSHREPRVPLRPPAPQFAREGNRFAASDWLHLAHVATYVDALTSPGRYVLDALVDASDGVLADRLHLVPSGVSDQFLTATRRRPRGGTTRFLSCGRLGAEKRVDAIIRAFAMLGRDDAELIIVGEGVEADGLRRLAERVRQGTIQFAGHIGDVTRLAQEYADADVFILASHRFDTQGLVLAEAAASGTPILYCDDRLQVGVTSENSLLSGPSPEDLAAAMKQLMEDPGRLERMAAASRALGPSLTSDSMGDSYLAVYDDTLDRFRRRSAKPRSAVLPTS